MFYTRSKGIGYIRIIFMEIERTWETFLPALEIFMSGVSSPKKLSRIPIDGWCNCGPISWYFPHLLISPSQGLKHLISAINGKFFGNVKSDTYIDTRLHAIQSSICDDFTVEWALREEMSNECPFLVLGQEGMAQFSYHLIPFFGFSSRFTEDGWKSSADFPKIGQRWRQTNFSTTLISQSKISDGLV